KNKNEIKNPNNTKQTEDKYDRGLIDDDDDFDDDRLLDDLIDGIDDGILGYDRDGNYMKN
ncbi:unnamed protein product, partial [Rotaria sp. Silwood2]